ncbi:YdeI/OmpD-associated family protein [Nakamurella leprariae]|uniref:YdeI/OmpD-associated family protein n=1 Tax=Nakamurella leprariae TaxID=2803911 RepID=A0A938YJ29_9ACTN|nr:YdeI/OmpD-associated family protein [Nakamurella leprariae]MBM9468710.1 YdeI/OmpD-associated family protein [Nakamurella leprariae]
MSTEPEPLTVADVAAWRAWLNRHEDDSDGVWLTLAKKGVTVPTSLTYAQALPEALCSGWIDGQAKRLDDQTYRQRFTPRRKRSLWSQRNVGFVAGLIEQGRMRPRGHTEIERAKADGRWDRAYAGPASAQVPEDLIAALAARPDAGERFEALSGQDRYLLLHQLMTATTPAVRAARLQRIVAGLAHGRPPAAP